MKIPRIPNRFLPVCLAWFAIAIGCEEVEEEDGRKLSLTGDTVAVIGALDGADHEVFGRLIRVGTHEDHGLFLVDFQRTAIFWYGFDGVFHDALVQQGEGPGDLGTPWDIHVDPEWLWVLDRGNFRMSQFALQEDNQITYVRSVSSIFPDGSICRLGERAFRGGVRDGYTLHELDDDGTFLRSMGPTPEIASVEEFGMWLPFVESQLLQGEVYCAEDEGMVVVAANAHPLIRAFDEGGAVRWETELSGIHSIEFHVTDGGGLQSEPNPETGANFLRSIIPWNDGTLLLQYDIRMPGEPPDDQENLGIDSRLIDLVSGEELARSMELPLIRARAGQHVVLLDNLPFPRATVLEVRDMR